MKHTENLLHIASRSNISVLLQGESGSGKEVAARFIHQHSKRCNGPFVALNCGAIAQSLAESILEGARKGAFTGAVGDQQGVVRAANGGTLFLDEIGEMPLEAQCKLLRILQERSVMPLGMTANIPVDFRLICATNRNLRREVSEGRFREDLYFRLNVFPIKVPPLRERDDFEELARNLWQEVVYNQEVGDGFSPPSQDRASRDATGPFNASPLSTREIQILAEKKWPGNIRQLKNVLERFALLRPYGTTLGEILREEFSDIADDAANILMTTRNLSDKRQPYTSGYTPRDYLRESTFQKDSADIHPQETFGERHSTNPQENFGSGLSKSPQAASDSRRLYNPTPRWDVLREELHKNNWNKTVTAQKLGISRGSLCYHVKKNDRR